ncbi:MAG TPA: aldehyde dehydrogenase [Spirochaetia bacterium]|nr:aldehyde dehydrogenase [Spirochaetia bacterium]
MHTTGTSLNEIVENAHRYFLTDATKPLAFRLEQLKSLRDAIQSYEERILAALKADLHKSAFEGYMTEVGMVLDELRFVMRHLRQWAQKKPVATPIAQFHGRSFIAPEPYGVVLIMSPWNYPFQLSMTPLIGAIAAGNCAVVKPSAYAPHVSQVIADMIASCFDPSFVHIVQGGRKENEDLLKQKFDYIFFTGGEAVGHTVMEAAAKHLTPLTLELGGKSPCIVDKTAQIGRAARRITFGKFLNAGQTCVAPDYVLVQEDVKDSLIEGIMAVIHEFFLDEGYIEENYPHIINEKHFDRLMALMEGERILTGGRGVREKRFIEPTVLDGITFESRIMQEEIFGPILPIITFTDIDEVIATLKTRPKPLALYLFTTDKVTERTVLESVSFGGGCINDTIIHLATSRMGFGGVGESGMGSYHGKHSFDTFTHYRSIVKKYNWIDLPLRYHPYTKLKLKVIKRVMR